MYKSPRWHQLYWHYDLEHIIVSVPHNPCSDLVSCWYSKENTNTYCKMQSVAHNNNNKNNNIDINMSISFKCTRSTIVEI